MLGIVCGIEAEAKIARKISKSNVICAGARPQRARWLTRELVRCGAKRLMSFGIAGALEPGLPVGTMVIGAQVVASDGLWTCDGAWVAELMQRFPEAHCGGTWGSETLIATVKEKRTLYEKSRCLIVDMESQCVAQIAAEASLPLAVVRVVCDSSDMDVPPVVMQAINDDGTVNLVRALKNILRHPTQIPDILKVRRGSGRALKVLREAARGLSSLP